MVKSRSVERNAKTRGKIFHSFAALTREVFFNTHWKVYFLKIRLLLKTPSLGSVAKEL